MPLGLILALSVCPAMLGTQEAIRQSQSKSKREEHRARRCNLVVSCVKRSIRSRDINNKLVVLRDNKLFISHEIPQDTNDHFPLPDDGHPFAGYFLPYPDSKHEGLVSTIMEEPPVLNWIYVDQETYEIKYGVRDFAQPNLTGPFDCTKQDRRMTLEGWEGFCAVEETPGSWALYFDRDDDGLKRKLPMGTRVLEVELIRREKKERKPKPDIPVPKTLEEMMEQHKAQTAKDEADKAAFLEQQRLEEEQHQDYPQGESGIPRREEEDRGYHSDSERSDAGAAAFRVDDAGPGRTIYEPTGATDPIRDAEKRQALHDTLHGLDRINSAFIRMAAGQRNARARGQGAAPTHAAGAPSDTATYEPSTTWYGSERRAARHGQCEESVTAASSVYSAESPEPKSSEADSVGGYMHPYVESDEYEEFELD